MINWRVYALVLLGLFASTQSNASHIVGGEFELIYNSGDQYTLNLNLYFDVKEGNIGARDNSLTAAIYRKSDNQMVSTIWLSLRSTTRVEYFQPACSFGEVVTDKLIYSNTISLPASIYNDPEGYYVAWERCCRNYTIDNIYSTDTEINRDDYAGQTFYLEFPSVLKDGEPYRNSSPILFPPLNDYACPNTSYWVNFEGTDPDGDSLVYSLVTPLSTHEPEPLAANRSAGPAPYPEVKWRTDLGFNLDNIMAGAPDIKISDDGFLTVTPTKEGLFVFAVKVEEYRDSVKIGEVRRDFQLLVLDKCTVAEPPVIKGKKMSDINFSYRDNMSISFPANTPEDQRCFEVQVTDPDALKIDDNFTENVWIHAIPIGFKDDVSDILPEDITATLVNGSDTTFQICFPACPYLESGYFNIGIVAFDDACTLPLSDTLRVDVFVEPPPNSPPYFVDGTDLQITVEELAGGYLSRNLLARDTDNHDIVLDIIPEGFIPEEYGISLNEVNNKPGEVEALLEWNYDCQIYSFNDRTSFPLTLIAVDENCHSALALGDTLKLTLNIEHLNDTKPDVNISLNSENDNYHSLEQPINETLSFSVTAKDEDNDHLILDGAGLNFAFNQHQITFNSTEGDGKPGISSNFSWELPCDFDLERMDFFNLHFYVNDQHVCKTSDWDTIRVDIKLSPPATENPTLNAFALGNTSIYDQTVKIKIGEPIELKLIGADIDQDNLILSLANLDDFLNAEFPTVSGKAQVSSNFFWNPGCEIFEGNIRDSLILTGNFLVADDNCYQAKSDTLSVDLIIYDADNFEEQFNAPNIITPNNDHKNDFFALESIFNMDGSNRSMPKDNCAGQFKNIEIYNRWGKKIYESPQRDFKWQPNREAAGIYYYYLIYTDKTYKGFIHVMF